MRRTFLEWLVKWNPLLDLAVPSVFSALIVAAVIAQAFIYDAQRRIMNDTRQVIADQREEMNKQSGIMEKSLSLSERSLSLSERAYVGVASLTANMRGSEVEIMLENIGRIPATNVSLHAQEYRWTHEHSTSSTTDFDAVGVPLFPGKFMMHIFVPLIGLKPEEIDAINAKREVLAIVGTIHYEDGFGKRDATYFAFEYQPPPKDEWAARPSIIEATKRREQAK